MENHQQISQNLKGKNIVHAPVGSSADKMATGAHNE